MSLINQDMLQPRKRGVLPGDEKKPLVPDKILHPSRLLDIAKAFFENEKIAHKERQEAVRGKYRTRDMFERFAVRDVSGNVNDQIWNFMINSAMRGMLKTIMNSQNNGDWKILDAEVEIVVDGDAVENIVTAVRWVDMNNEDDLAYVNGQPAMNVNVTNTLPPELVDRISNSGDSELKDLMKQLVTALLTQATGAKPAEPKSTDDE